MAVVLVTGGTGTLGRALVPTLLEAGHAVRVLSRQAHPPVPPGALAVRGDVRTGAGVARAVAGSDVVVHAATSPRWRARQTEVEGARHVAAAARTAGAQLTYVSIVGVDAHRYSYYRAKHAAEQVVAGAGCPWSVLRATQFHDLIEAFLRPGWFVRTPNLRFQPVDVGDVATRLAEVALGPPQGLVEDFAGPEVLTIEALAATRREATGRRTRLVRAPSVGFLRDFDAGRHLAPEHARGTVTWGKWLADRG